METTSKWAMAATRAITQVEVNQTVSTMFRTKRGSITVTAIINGGTPAREFTLTLAEVSALKILGLAFAMNREIARTQAWATMVGWAVRLGQRTYGFRSQPWRFSVHSATARRLQERSPALVNCRHDIVQLTDAGVVVAAKFVKDLRLPLISGFQPAGQD